MRLLHVLAGPDPSLASGVPARVLHVLQMKVWIETYRVEPPHDVTISGRFGSSVMFVYHSRLLQEWFWLQPNSIIERIAEPQMLFLDEAWIRDHPSNRPRAEGSYKIHRQKEQQLRLF